MVKKPKSDYQYAFVLAGSAALIIVFVAFLGIKPSFTKNTELRAEKKQKDIKLQQLQEKERVLIELKERASEIKKDSERVAAALPTESEVGRLFIQLDEITKSSGGTLRSVSIDKSNSEQVGSISGVDTINYGLPIDAPSYFALKKFFESSEEALRLLNINSVRIDSSDSGEITATIGAQSYVRVK